MTVLPHDIFRATARIREGGSRGPIVCLIAVADAGTRQTAFDAGVDAYVCKGSLRESLVPAVRAALAGRGSLAG